MITSMRCIAAIAGVALFVLLVVAIIVMPEGGVPLALQVQEHLPETGTEHPITAVLLSFRALDTLLEIAVLVVAVLVGVQGVSGRGELSIFANPLLVGLVNWLAPLLWLVAVYLLWSGGHQPGGAFQAGALLAASLIMLRLVGRLPVNAKSTWLRVSWVAGVGVFLLVATLSWWLGAPFLGYPDGWQKTLIFAIEAALTLSIGWVLFGLLLAMTEEGWNGR